MKHLTFAEKSLLIGDDAADALLEYLRVLSTAGEADTVELAAVGADGDDVVVSMVLSSGAPMIVETTRSSVPEPDNTAAVKRMRDLTRRRVSPATVQPDEEATSWGPEDYELA
ncbi:MULTISPECIES: hypothetical protein [unclassified Leifsonia]|uniref:hypothetical protein n=1 Tax=unclassified Leifsonia TaxID=2663824 RepID=UPI0006F509BF|nr:MULTISPECIES: hypothetical protein [unclassified Leifsonia]KQX06920.1 hypothetical protein ASC59_03625 [Leifsonia sp. Root1293]KRA11204.1 hypothetical protein ASD61_03625 [Leifsonia sp. Root60]